jgi:pre-mRNA-processing factor 17
MSGLLGAGYYSSDDDTANVPKVSVTTATKVVAAPEVNTEVWSPTPIPIFYSKP